EKSSSNVGPEDDEEISLILWWEVSTINVSQRFRKYQIETLEKVITRENPYAISDSILPTEVLSSLRNASADFLKGKNVFLSLSDSEIGRVDSRIFNDMCSSVPDVSPTKISEDEHSFNTATRPDFLCLVNEIPILNSEIKPSGFTPLQQQKDKLKVQLRGRKSINQLLRTNGSLEETSNRMLWTLNTMDFTGYGLFQPPDWSKIESQFLCWSQHSAFCGTRDTYILYVSFLSLQ
ncbi:2299_t:CDS:2, partial [Funneliformis geosporum]